MPYRDVPLVEGGVYHIFNKSIAEFKIFNNASHFARVMGIIRYYQLTKQPLSFSNFIKMKPKNSKSDISLDKEKIVGIIAYCIMPTHLHLVLKQLKDNGISIFMNKVLSSYSHYFNIKYKRRGPLWEGRFKSRMVQNDEYLLHLTRYIHLNPVTAGLVNKPEEWPASSYQEYLQEVDAKDGICQYNEVLDINPELYRKFTEDRVSYQKELAKIKHLTLD